MVAFSAGSCGRSSTVPLAILVILGGVTTASSEGLATESNTAREMAAVIRSEFELPLQVDEITLINDIRAEGTTIVFDYTLLLRDEADVADMFAVMRNSLSTAVCGRADFKRMWEAGLTIEFRYRNLDGSEFDPIVFPIDLCQP